MTEHALGTVLPHEAARPAPAATEPEPRAEAELPVEEPAESSETLGAASMFIIPIVTFILIVTMWYSVGGF